MHNQFFKDTPSRSYNPTFLSSNVRTSLNFSQSQSQLIKRFNNLSNQKAKYQARQIIYSNPQQSNVNIVPLDLKYRRIKTNLSSVGSNSLANLERVSDKDVFDNQQKKYNIVTMINKQYNQGIKLFPKLRNQMNEDQRIKKRKQLLMGRAQFLKKNHKIQKVQTQQIPSTY